MEIKHEAETNEACFSLLTCWSAKCELNKVKDQARRQGDESLLSITNEWLKARMFGEVPKRLQGARSAKWEQIKLA